MKLCESHHDVRGKHFEGRVPQLEALNERDKALIAELERVPDVVGASLEKFRFRDASEQMMGLARAGNKYFNDSEPWKTRKTDPAVCGTTINLSLQVCASLSVLMEPLLPDACSVLRRMLSIERSVSSTPSGRQSDALGWLDAKQRLLAEGSMLGTPEILFHKLSDDTVADENARIDEMNARQNTEEKPYMDVRPTATFDDFMKMDLRVARVLEAERVPKSKKLIRTIVDLGFEKRQILAGVAEHLSPESR